MERFGIFPDLKLLFIQCFFHMTKISPRPMSVASATNIRYVQVSNGYQGQGDVAKSPRELKSNPYQGAPSSSNLASRMMTLSENDDDDEEEEDS